MNTFIARHLINIQKEMVVDTKLYDILGVSPEVDASALKKAYRDLVRKHHPDKGGDPEKFKEIDAAYKVLSNEELREMYDNTGSVEAKNTNFDGADVDILSHIFSNMGFGNIFSHGDPFSQHVKQKTQDVVHELHLPLDALYTGKTKNVSIKRQVICKGCTGKGGSDPKTCNVCGGSGITLVQHQNRTIPYAKSKTMYNLQWWRQNAYKGVNV